MSAKPQALDREPGTADVTRQEAYDQVRVRISRQHVRQAERERTQRRRLLWMVAVYGAGLAAAIYALFG